jgi:hypothetical protein
MDYTIYAALSDEVKEGWVWLREPQMLAFTPIEIHNPVTGRSVYCECRRIDSNFMRKYNELPRITIDDHKRALVISEWVSRRTGSFGEHPQQRSRCATGN